MRPAFDEALIGGLQTAWAEVLQLAPGFWLVALLPIVVALALRGFVEAVGALLLALVLVVLLGEGTPRQVVFALLAALGQWVLVLAAIRRLLLHRALRATGVAIETLRSDLNLIRAQHEGVLMNVVRAPRKPAA